MYVSVRVCGSSLCSMAFLWSHLCSTLCISGGLFPEAAHHFLHYAAPMSAHRRKVQHSSFAHQLTEGASIATCTVLHCMLCMYCMHCPAPHYTALMWCDVGAFFSPVGPAECGYVCGRRACVWGLVCGLMSTPRVNCDCDKEKSSCDHATTTDTYGSSCSI